MQKIIAHDGRGRAHVMNQARVRKMKRSRMMSGSTLGRWIFTATCSPCVAQDRPCTPVGAQHRLSTIRLDSRSSSNRGIHVLRLGLRTMCCKTQEERHLCGQAAGR